MKYPISNKSKNNRAIFIAFFSFVFLFSLILYPLSSLAAINQQMNYQGKLTNSSNVAVADGTYNVEFKLYTVSSGGSAIWTETRTGANKVQVTNGLFSVMLGSVTSLSGINFNQTLYLGVNIGGTGSPSWDGEMNPRKILGTVPAAFEALSFGGATSTQYVRSDQAGTIAASSASSLFRLNQSGAGNAFDIYAGATNLFTVLSGGNVGIGTTSPSATFSVAGAGLFLPSGSEQAVYAADTHGNIGILADRNNTESGVYGSGNSYGVYGTSGGTAGVYGLGISTTPGVMGESNNATGKALYALQNNASGYGVYSSGGKNYFSGNVGIGTTTPNFLLSVAGASNFTNALNFNGAAGSAGNILQSNGSASAPTWVGTSTLGLLSSSVTSSLSNGFIPRWNGSALINSIVSENGTVAGVNATSSSYTFNVQGTSGVNPFNVASSTGTSLFSILKNGNVGIGTSSPVAKLDVSASLTGASDLKGISSTVSLNDNDNYLYNQYAGYFIAGGTGSVFNSYGIYAESTNNNTDGTSYGVYGKSGQTGVVGNGINGVQGNSNASNGRAINAIQSDANGYAVYSSGGKNYFSGNVGIGINTPGSLLTVVGTSSLRNIIPEANLTYNLGTTALRFNQAWISTVNIGTSTWSLTQSTGNGRFSIFDAENGGGTERLSILPSNGNVGIGTTTPSAKLAITGTAGTGDVFTVASSTNARLLTVKNTGNVGIGISNPSYMLEVNGSGYYNGPLTTNGAFNATDIYANSASIQSLDVASSISGSGFTSSVASALNTLNPIMFGYQNTSTGGGADVALGYYNTTSADRSIAIGAENSAVDLYAIALGVSNTSNNDYDISVGSYNTVDSNNDGGLGYPVMAFGYQNNVIAAGSVVLGMYNNVGQGHGYPGITVGVDNEVYSQGGTDYASAFGYSNYVVNSNSMALGFDNEVTRGHSIAIGSGFSIGSTYTTMIGDANGNYVTLDGAGFALNSGSYYGDGSQLTGISDKAVKTNYTELDKKEILEKINSLDIEQWAYQKDPSVNHIGPYAQDFFAAFHLGNSDKTISFIDPSGVALVGVQGLSEKIDDINASTTDALASIDLRLENLENLSFGATHGFPDSNLTGDLLSTIQSFGSEIVDGISYLKNVFVQHLTTQNLTIKGKDVTKTGFTIYDRVTEQPLCVYFVNGQMQTENGECPDSTATSTSEMIPSLSDSSGLPIFGPTTIDGEGSSPDPSSDEGDENPIVPEPSPIPEVTPSDLVGNSGDQNSGSGNSETGETPVSESVPSVSVGNSGSESSESSSASEGSSNTL